MSATAAILFTLAALVAAGWTWAFVVAPWKQFCEALRKMAAGDENAAFLVSRPFWLRVAVADLCRLGDHLGETRRRQNSELLDLQAILGSLSEGVLVIDRHQRIRLANDSLHRLFNLPGAAGGRTLMEVFRDHGLRETALAALENGAPQSRQISTEIMQDGRYTLRHFAVTMVRMGDAAGAIAIFHDITDLNTLSTARRDFVANVSHELRTPLSIINGYLETLLDGALEDGPTARRFLEIMTRHGKRLNLLIEDLLSLSQLESRPGGGLVFEPVDLRTCLEHTVERLEPLIAEKGAVVTLDLPKHMPEIEADAPRLEQVFVNLLENALKYGAAASPTIRVGVRAHAAEARISVTDNGPGIPMADQPHIFERFYRVHKDRARTVGGTGLGLSIVKHVVEAHGGAVTVQSLPGRGASFLLRLPMTQES